jgi:hypothetical protein
MARPLSKLHDAVRTAAQVVDAGLPLAEIRNDDLHFDPTAQDRLSLRAEAFREVLWRLIDDDWTNDRDEPEGPSGA